MCYVQCDLASELIKANYQYGIVQTYDFGPDSE